MEQAVLAWEKRNYWLKADRFRQEWAWAAAGADRLATLLRAGDIHGATRALLPLLPHVRDLRIARFRLQETRWRGAAQRLRAGE